MSEDFIIPFGKYKGKKLGEIDDLPYLDWMVGLDDLYPDTKAALESYLAQPEIARELDKLLDKESD